MRIGDIAEVTDSVEDKRVTGVFNGKDAISLIIFRQPGANIIQTVDQIHALIPKLKSVIPSDISVNIALDRTSTIRASVEDVQFTLVLSIVLVVLVVFLFLRNLTATFIPAVAVVVSLVGTFGAMYLLDYSLDNFSLMALTIATGFVVDDAIVVIENISRHLEAGMKPKEAAKLGAAEIGFTVFSISVSLVAVFIPILLMSGIVGRLFREFAMTLSIAIAVSMIVSLTTTPMMCAYLLRSAHESKRGWLFRLTERFFDGMLSLYGRSLHWVLNWQWATLLLTLIVTLLTGWLFVKIQKGFFPQQDTGRITVRSSPTRTPQPNHLGNWSTPWYRRSQKSPTSRM